VLAWRRQAVLPSAAAILAGRRPFDGAHASQQASSGHVFIRSQGSGDRGVYSRALILRWRQHCARRHSLCHSKAFGTPNSFFVVGLVLRQQLIELGTVDMTPCCWTAAPSWCLMLSGTVAGECTEQQTHARFYLQSKCEVWRCLHASSTCSLGSRSCPQLLDILLSVTCPTRHACCVAASSCR
jgi:hypothetical protein